jgi:hypothetical protein
VVHFSEAAKGGCCDPADPTLRARFVPVQPVAADDLPASRLGAKGTLVTRTIPYPKQDGGSCMNPRFFGVRASGLGVAFLLCIATGFGQRPAQDFSSASRPPQAAEHFLSGDSSVTTVLPSAETSAPCVASLCLSQGKAPRRSVFHPGAGSGAEFKGSVSIPLDSWIYPVLDRLAALGYMPESTAMIRPYTRLETARLVDAAHEHYFEMNDVGESLLASLDQEFADETRILAGGADHEAQWESGYSRLTGIGGTPIRDGFHFSQTLVDDFGRPYGKGANNVTGLAAEASAGPFAVYFRSEYQFASELPLSIYDGQAQEALVSSDGLPFGWDLRFGDTNRLRPIEAYAALSLGGWQLSLGQQSLWWGPDRGTSLILSNNAAGLPMLRLDRAKPGHFSGWLKVLGPVHFDFFMAREGGIHFVRLGPNFVPYGTSSAALTPPPYFWGAHVTIKPTANFELGFAHTVIFAGYGRPFTFGTFLHSFSIQGNGQEVDPGKRVTEVNLAYHIPGFRRAIQVYSEGMAWDDPAQGKFVARFAWDPGIYISALPKFHQFDARFEGVYTDLPKGYQTGYFYANTHYPQGYTNYGQIMGSWVGREGIGGQASTTYWHTPQKKVTVFYRKMVSDAALLNGGRNTDFGATVSWRVRPDIELNGLGQYERWNFPLLQQTSRSNVAGSVEFRFYPPPRSHSRPAK